MRLTLTALVLVAALAVSAGCGQSDAQKVRDVAAEYIETIADRDFAATCALFTAAYRSRLGGEAACEAAQAEQYPPGATTTLELADVHVKGERARANLLVSRGSAAPSPLGLLLALTAESDWRIRGQR